MLLELQSQKKSYYIPFYLFVYIAQKSIKWGKNNFYKRFYGQKVMKIGHFYECILMNNSEYFS